MSPSSIMRPVSTDGSRVSTAEHSIAASTNSICSLYGSRYENMRFISCFVTFGLFFFSSSVRYPGPSLPFGGGIGIPPLILIQL